VDFDNPDMKLFPGMTAYVTVPVATANDVVKLPNGALRFVPDLTADQISALYLKAGIAAAGARDCPLAVCGAMAAEPLAVPLLLGLGVSELSVVPARVPAVKALVTRLVLAQCRALASAALALEHAAAVRALVREWLSERALAPGGE